MSEEVKDFLRIEISTIVSKFNESKLRQAVSILNTIKDADIDTVKRIYLQFCETAGAKIILNQKKIKQIRARLENFTEEEIVESIKFRKTIPWYSGGSQDGKIWYKDWESLFRSDEKIENMLSRMPKEKREAIKGKVLFT